MYLVDTNIFLEVMLKRGRSGECKELLRALRDGKVKGVVTDFTIHSIIVLLDRFQRLEALKGFLLSLRAYRGLYIYDTSIGCEVRAVDLAEETGLDMDDAIQYSVALAVNAEAIVSFDKDFNNLNIPRKEPREILEKLGTAK